MGREQVMTFKEAISENRIWFAVFIVIIAVMYFKIASGMAVQWYEDENYSHGFLVPLIAGYFLYQRLPAIFATAARPANSGALVIALAVVMYVLGNVGAEYFTQRVSMVILLIGLVIYSFGYEVFKKMALPLGYLFLMVPLPYIVYDSFAFPLKIFVTKVSVIALKLMGIIVLREGNIIMFPNIVLEVADACSGMRSMVSLLALSVAIAFVGNFSSAKKWMIVLAAVPVAIITNALRVIITGLLAQFWGAAAAEGFFHEFAGLVVFGLAMVMLIVFAAVLRRKA
ncbi:MAG: exosortase/archaeosortase family protein [Nitrospiraceae bacterium]|nr:exosortase/archaeosortase family protein [Nitrospiraceae bacterium]